MDVDLAGEARGPLSGIRVLDLATVVSGPLCGQILGDLGADVVKLEAPGGDSARVMGQPIKEGISPLFHHCNRNKRSIGIDLKSEAGRAVARRLAASSDVLIENFRPGVAERLGLGYESIRADNPGLVYVAINGFGPDGPRRDEPAYDTVIQGLTGFMPAQGGDDPPRLIQSIAADKVTALTAAYATMAALFARERGAEQLGQRVDVPMLDAFAAFLMPDVMAGKTCPDEPEAPSLNIHRTWATADGYVVMMIVEDRQFFGLCRALEREDLIDDPRCVNLLQRLIHVDELFAILAEELVKWPTAEILKRTRDFGAPVAPVNDIDAFLTDPQVEHNRTVFELDHDPALGRMRHVRAPARFERTPATLRRVAPRKGEHTREILLAADFTDSEIDALLQQGAVVSG
jgi:crotonobetainyl-CoA:carnitine CoA-transferase CaiB-like acyl-CoA transferase